MCFTAMSAEPAIQDRVKPPIDSLPPEILSEIFLFAITRPYRMFGDLYRGPWLLGRVCRRWRDTAWSCAALWSSFSVHWPEHGKEDVGERLLMDALRHTGHKGLSMTILLSNDFPNAIIQGLVRHSSQWEDVHIPTPSCLPWTQLTLSNPPSLHLPSLKSLVVGRQPTVDSLAAILSMFSHTPNLRSFKFNIYHTRSDFDPSAIGVPWWQLTSLVMVLGPMRDCPVEASIKVLRLCSNLETLREETILHSVPESIMVTLPRLGSLSVRSPEILYYLVCPALEHLSILPRYDAPFSIPPLSQLIAHSRCQLRSLDIWLWRHLADPGELFSCVPHLRKLVLRVECYDKDVAELLKYLTLGDTSMMLPSLNIFELKVQELFTGKTHLEELDEVLVRIIDARWNVPKELSVAQLRQVRISKKTRLLGTLGRCLVSTV
ncbi:uncharacterized protein BT62DRAFT_101498 [Guyanagaster necrorhizus]|uniref:F-box domain-containing protein n=1 Tax=Guyanagaster necrorhizus TaxID=856835 RepID=A0A9P7VUA0_9AGAR|nr:uncharacterized protein BT62DRAFT_101498 [Guyanagaster necrorhizus MCA 3950]KAG7447069.1 hypothetical protein BT62DRAFT_101498 [Guyanagaster necrorhizus MCA 3950]